MCAGKLRSILRWPAPIQCSTRARKVRTLAGIATNLCAVQLDTGLQARAFCCLTL